MDLSDSHLGNEPHLRYQSSQFLTFMYGGVELKQLAWSSWPYPRSFSDMLGSICTRWYTMVHADGSVLKTWDYLRQRGLEGVIEILTRPTAIVWKIIAVYAAFEAALQLLLPGKTVRGPISPAGNQPVYKVYSMNCTSSLYFNTAL